MNSKAKAAPDQEAGGHGGARQRQFQPPPPDPAVDQERAAHGPQRGEEDRLQPVIGDLDDHLVEREQKARNR